MAIRTFGLSSAITGTLNQLQNVAGATLMAWVLPEAVDTIFLEFEVGGGGGAPRLSAGLDAVPNWFGNGRRLDGDVTSTTTDGAAALGALTHVAVVADYVNGTLDDYVNGALAATTSPGGWAGNSSNTASNTASIGSQLSAPLDGDVADARVYSRALSPLEIATIFESRGRDSILLGMANRWKLIESPPGVAFATTLVDTAGRNDATPLLAGGQIWRGIKSRRRRSG